MVVIGDDGGRGWCCSFLLNLIPMPVAVNLAAGGMCATVTRWVVCVRVGIRSVDIGLRLLGC